MKGIARRILRCFLSAAALTLIAFGGYADDDRPLFKMLTYKD